MVAEQSGLAFTFLLDGGRGQHQVLLVSDQVIGQDGPEPVLDELGHFFAEEGSLLGSGGVAAALDALIFLLKSPRFGGGLSGDTMVSPVREQRSGWVVEEKLGQEVGRASKVADKLLPGRGGGEAGCQVAN